MKFTKDEAAELMARAERAGREAAEAKVPVPMIVQELRDPFDPNSEVVKEYAPVLSGVCGFAWVRVVPGGSSFARWLTASGKGRKDSYAGGVSVWVRGYGQSLERKEAYASAMAGVLKEAGVHALAESRMD